MSSANILGVRIDATTYEEATRTLVGWAREKSSRSVCHANVHMVMEAHDDADFRYVVNGSDLVTADGMPLVWAQRLKGIHGAERVYGPTLMLHLLEAAEANELPVAFYGGSEEAVSRMLSRFRVRFPSLKVAFAKAPPFSRTPGNEDDDQALRQSGARLVFVGLGCPKQEKWMAARRGKLDSVMLGVGAAFDFHAGLVKQAPEALQQLGLEWAFRLAMEPRRLWRRYARHNPRFVALLARELLERGSR